MARKRLNKKVAIIGSAFMAILLLGVIVVALYFSKDPYKFLEDAELLLSETNKQAEELSSKGDYSDEEKEAVLEGYGLVDRNYGQAFGCAKEDELKINILFKLAEFHLLNNEFHTSDWRKALGSWRTVTNIDPQHIEARRKGLDYFYEMAKSGNNNVWNTVKTEAGEMIDIMEKKGSPPDPYILMAKARAGLEITDLGQESDLEESILSVIEELEHLREANGEDVDVYLYLGRAEIIKGDIESSKGTINAKKNAVEKTEAILQDGIEHADDKAQAHINYLSWKLDLAISEMDRAKVDAMGSDFEAMAEEFSTQAKVYTMLSRYYQLTRDLDKSVEVIEKAVELDPENVRYAITTAHLLHTYASVNNNNESLNRAIDVATNALNLPDAQDVPGPKQFANRQNKLVLHSLLARFYIEMALEAGSSGDEARRADLIAKAGDTIHEIEQFFGTSDNVTVLKWQGLLAFADNDKVNGIRKMFNAYEQLKASGQSDSFLSYTLAGVFKDRPEIGTRAEFLDSAIFRSPQGSIVLNRPESILEYAEVASEMSAFAKAINLVKIYESENQANDRTTEIYLRACIAAGRYDDAAAKLSEMDAGSVNTMALKLSLANAGANRILRRIAKEERGLGLEDFAISYQPEDLANYRKERVELVDKLLGMAPEKVEFPMVLVVCREYLDNGKPESARLLVDKFLLSSPDNLSAKLYKRILLEPDPQNVPVERRDQITKEVFTDIPDEKERHVTLGEFYAKRGLTAEAQAEFKKAYSLAPDSKDVAGTVFGMALMLKDEPLIKELIAKAQADNIDECGGNFFAAQYDLINEDYQNALLRIEEGLKISPVFSRAYLLRGQINEKLGRTDEAIKDISTAARMNPVDEVVNRQKALLLYSRNFQLGSTVTDAQVLEVDRALMAAMILNPGDWTLRSLYAESISDREPDRALAIRSQLQKQLPNITNALLLGQMALRMAQNESDTDKSKMLFETASWAYKEAYDMEPDNKSVVDSYSEYLRITGQAEKAAALFEGQKGSLWKFYARDGRYDEANEVLKELYSANPKDVEIVRGLLVMSEKTDDGEGVKKYSEELLALDNTIENELLQIRMYLSKGFVDESTNKLASFRERNPENPEGMLLESWSALENGKLKKAMELINRYLESNPDSASAWRLRGRVHNLLGDFNLAVEDLQKSRSILDNAEISMDLSRAYYRVGRTSEAIGELATALKDPQAPRQIRVMLEKLYMQANDKVALEDLYRETLAKYPNDGIWHLRAGKFAMDNDKFDEAQELLAKAWQLGQEQIGGHRMALDLYLESLFLAKKYQKMLDYASQYIDTPFAPIAYGHMAEVKFEMGSRATSLDYYHNAIEKAGTDEALVTAILDNMLKTVGVTEVIRWCNDELKADADSLTANHVLYALYHRRGEHNKALEYIEKCMEITAARFGTDSKAWNNYQDKKVQSLLIAYMKTSDKQYLSSAVSIMEAMLEKYPDNASVLNNLAYLFADNNEQLDKAADYASRAVKIAPSGSNLDTYAYVLCKIGRYAEAEEHLLRARQIYERQSMTMPSDVHVHFGMAQEGLGRPAEAVLSYQQALKVGKGQLSEEKSRELEEIIDRLSE